MTALDVLGLVATCFTTSSFVPQVAHSTVTDTVQIRLTTRPR